MAGVNMRLGPGVVRELHWHKEAEWPCVSSGGRRPWRQSNTGRLDQRLPVVLAWVLEAVQRSHFAADVFVARRELVAEERQDRKIDFVGAVRVRAELENCSGCRLGADTAGHNRGIPA
jgi:hypothetical protein